MQKVIEEAKNLLIATYRKGFHDSLEAKQEAHSEEVGHLRTVLRKIIAEVDKVLDASYDIRFENDNIQLQSREAHFSHRTYINPASIHKLSVQYFPHEAQNSINVDFVFDIKEDGQRCWRDNQQVYSTKELGELIIIKVIKIAQEYIQGKTNLSS